MSTHHIYTHTQVVERGSSGTPNPIAGHTIVTFNPDAKQYQLTRAFCIDRKIW